MESFLNNKNTEKQETPNKILGWFDEHILENGVPGVIEKMLKKFNGNLPKVVIYPETSARPLYYVFDPVFEKIAKIKHQDKPKIIFFKVNQPDISTAHYEDEGPFDRNNVDKLVNDAANYIKTQEVERRNHWLFDEGTERSEEDIADHKL